MRGFRWFYIFQAVLGRDHNDPFLLQPIQGIHRCVESIGILAQGRIIFPAGADLDTVYKTLYYYIPNYTTT